MASTTRTSINGWIEQPAKRKKKTIKEEIMNTSEDPKEGGEDPTLTPLTQEDDLMDFGDLDFADHYGDDAVKDESQLLPKNTAKSAINCAFVGFGGGGGTSQSLSPRPRGHHHDPQDVTRASWRHGFDE